MKKVLLITFLLGFIFKSCQSKREIQSSKNLEIEEYITEMMNNHSIPGLAVAVIKDNSIIHKGFYGTKNLTTNEAISNKTVFKVFSLTKTIVATSMFKLIEEGKISLKDSLSMHFDGLPEKWQYVTIGNLLSHSSGLPDIHQLIKELEDDSIKDKEFIELLYNDEMEFATNNQWRYNQTNYILLKMLIEKISNSKFETYILNHQFKKTKSENVFFSAGSNVNIANQATYYDYKREKAVFEIKKEFSGDKNHPLAGINLTLDEYIIWNQRLDNDEHISEKTKMAMWTPFKFKESNRHFLYGWDVYTVNGFDSFGFSGGGVSGFRKFVDRNLTIIVLTTGYKNYPVQDIMIDHIAGIIDTSLFNEQTVLTEQVIGEYFLSNTTRDLKYIIEKVKQDNPKSNLEEIFKSIGYTLFFQLDRKEDAIDLFKANVTEYPKSYDTYGSLGYLYFLTEQYDLARNNYVKALELNPENSYSQRRIKEIDLILKNN
ncbi:serine hydrolase [Aureisphaera sp. CAU 1614]|uniref:Serine hydrolase n=1 Tax=Halomarinibacterium sedimenti TaxID=2857106 RepID=A0A9X1FP23_9FLAO|nr:serine hydrolase [Halomarinibacterium sedimenti]MBW2938066.1 serine hydrolase [Halomarinibacterium sedimenti]